MRTHLLSLSVCFWAGACLAAEYHVAENGNDTNAGTNAAPLRTIQQAADRAQPGDTVHVHKGVYRETVTLRKSGEPGRPIRFVAAAGEDVVLDGTDPLDARWEPYRAGISRAACKERFEQLFVDGRMMVEARWPNARFEDRWDRAKWGDSADGSRKDALVCQALKDSKVNWQGAFAVLNVAHQYKTWVRPITAFDGVTGTLRYELNERLGDGPDEGPTWADDKFFLFGKLEALDAPTEWFLDETTGTLYLMPGKETDLAKSAIAGKTRAYGFDLNGCRHIVLSGFRFFATTFRLVDCQDCLIEDCRLRYPTFVRVPGEGTPRGSLVTGDRNTIRRLSLAHTNAGGLGVTGADNRIEDCIVHDVNWYGDYSYAGILATAGAGGGRNAVQRCSVSSAGNIAILYGGRKSDIGFNHVFDAGKACKDIAAVHTGSPECRDSQAHHNWIHGSTGMGLRGDDQTRGLVVHHNVIWDCALVGMIIKGDDNLVYNNTLVGGRGGILTIPTEPEPKKWWTRNEPLPLQNPNSRFVNNAAATLFWRDKALGDRAKLTGNCFAKEVAGRGFKQVAEPASNAAWFRNAAELDFRPAAGSPLLGAGTLVEGAARTGGGKAIDIGAYAAGEDDWAPGATWLDRDIDLPTEIVTVIQRASAARQRTP